MKRTVVGLIFLIATSATSLSIKAFPADTQPNGVPRRAILLSGGQNGINENVMAVLYDTNDIHFQDPDAPRFLLIDREGNTVFGIGGYVEGQLQYDFDGAIDNNGFVTNSIDVPTNPANRNRLSANATHTNLVMQLLRNTRWGVLQAYVQTNFTGPNYGFKLKQAYLSLGHVTAGLTRSTFQDAIAAPPTIDYQGPSGAVSVKNTLLRYRCGFGGHFVWAIAAEMPRTGYTTADGLNQSINQRFPDIPAYLQYQWGGGKSHVRASALLRRLSYRNLTDDSNRFATGWGVQLSGAVNLQPVTIYYQANYGKGIGSYVNDLQGLDVDLVSSVDGKMTTPASIGITGGVKFQLTRNFFVSGAYSISRLYDDYAGDNDYRNGIYGVVNAFYTPISDLQVGVEYLRGSRTDRSGATADASRVEAMVKYSF